MSTIKILNDGKEYGPYSLEQVYAMYLAGTINSDTFYWTEGMEEWSPIDLIWNNDSQQIKPSRPEEKTLLETNLHDSVTEKGSRHLVTKIGGIIIVMLLICLVCQAGTSRWFSSTQEVTGSVFIVTNGAGNYKMGLVRVSFFRNKADSITAIQNQFNEERDKLLKEMSEIKDKYDSTDGQFETVVKRYKEVADVEAAATDAVKKSLDDLGTKMMWEATYSDNAAKWDSAWSTFSGEETHKAISDVENFLINSNPSHYTKQSFSDIDAELITEKDAMSKVALVQPDYDSACNARGDIISDYSLRVGTLEGLQMKYLDALMSFANGVDANDLFTADTDADGKFKIQLPRMRISSSWPPLGEQWEEKMRITIG